MKKYSRSPLYWLFACCLLVLSIPCQAANDKSPITLVTGPETLDLLKTLGEPLQQAAGIKPGDVHFHVMLDPTLNAMALPGQNIILNSGLILAVRNQDELAAVMAHEIAHLSAGHHIQLESALQDVSIQNMVAFVAGIAAGTLTGDGQLAQAAIVGGSAASQSFLLETMRTKEMQADRLAIRYLITSGFDPQGMVRFMERLNREQRLSNVPSPYLLTHPLGSQRLVESQQQITQQITQQTDIKTDGPLRAKKTLRRKMEKNALLARVQAVLEAGTSDDLNGVMARFRKRLAMDPNDFPARYGLAIAARYMGQLQTATSHLETLLKKHANDSYLLRERGLVRLEMGKPAAAEEDFRAALRYRPKQSNADLLYRLAFALYEQEKLADASRILRKLTLEHPFVAGYFYLLGVVEGKREHMGASHLALARHFYLIREGNMAQWHYREAIRQFPDTNPGKKIALNELKNLRRMKQR